MTLFIDTHDSLITIGLLNGDNLFIEEKNSEYSHSVFTMPMIKKIFEENNLDISDLTAIVVVNGPGSFTGIRIGLSIAKTIAYALKIKINTISSLKAYLISNDSEKDKMCVIEDNKGYYVCVFDKDNNVLIDEEYIEDNKYEYEEVSHHLNVRKILDYCSNLKVENAHQVKANYVKKIEVEK